jgi:molybdopterin-containing oxidoreductase family molybdopterin binding subunit
MVEGGRKKGEDMKENVKGASPNGVLKTNESAGRRAGFSRRTFVAGGAVAATVGVAGVLASCQPSSSDGEQEAGQTSNPAIEEGTWIPSQCNGCFNACSILGHVVDGVLVEIKGDDRSPAGWGHLCGKGLAGIQQLYDPNRITKPMKRTNPEKGLGVDPGWQEISWDEAYGLILEKLDEQKEKGLPIIVFALITSIISWIDSMNWLGSNGNFPLPIKADICGANIHSIAQLMTSSGNSLPDYRNCKYLMQFGTQAGVATRHGTSITAKILAEGRLEGMKHVSFDPHLSGGPEKADEWIPLRPGTDAAVALCFANLLVNEYDLYDKEFLTDRTNGPSLVDVDTRRIVRSPDGNKALYWDTSDNTAKPYDKTKAPALEGEFVVDGKKVRTAFSIYKEHIATYTPEYASQITTIPAETLRRIAKEFGEAACIGETIEVDGLTVPYRPVAVDSFSGVSRHKHGFHAHWALLSLNMLVGSIFSYGGYLGYYTENKYGFYDGDPGHRWEYSIWEEDGLIEDLAMAHGYPHQESYYRKIRESDFVPTTECLEELTPLSIDQHFGYISQVDPSFYNTTPSEVAFCMASNPLKNWCNHDYQADLLKSFKWIWGMDIYLNDSSYFYDLIIPEPCYLERYDPLPLSFNNHRVPGVPEVPFIVAGRQPIVAARDDCPSALDTFGALAAKAGKTAEFVGALNGYYQIAEEYTLPSDKQVTARAVCDAALKSLAGGDRGVDWFIENGVWTRERKADEVYVFAAGRPGRVPLYFDIFLEAKEKVEKVVDDLGIYWETEDWAPLPHWMPCVDYEITDPDYDTYPIYWTNAINTDTWQVENAWINEINESEDNTYFLEVNSQVAAKKNIKTADKIRLSNKDGAFVDGTAVVTELVHPECVASVGGHLNSKSKYEPIALNKGDAINHLVPAGDPKRMEYIGQGVDQCVRCKLEKIS